MIRLNRKESLWRSTNSLAGMEVVPALRLGSFHLAAQMRWAAEVLTPATASASVHSQNMGLPRPVCRVGCTVEWAEILPGSCPVRRSSSKCVQIMIEARGLRNKFPNFSVRLHPLPILQLNAGIGVTLHQRDADKRHRRGLAAAGSRHVPRFCPLRLDACYTFCVCHTQIMET